MKRPAVAVLFTAILLATPTWSLAQAIQNIVLRNSFNPLGAGARGLGMGGAFTAVADDGTAASFNPAGLSQLRRTEIALVGFSTSLTSTITSRGGAESVDKTRHGAPDFGGLVIPVTLGGRNLAFQFSYQRAVDLFGEGQASITQSFPLDEEDPQAGSVNFVGEIAPKQSGAFHTVTASAGYEVTSRLSLGVSLNYWLAKWTAQGTSSSRIEVFIPGERPESFPASDVRFEQRQDLDAFNLNAGFLLRYPRVSVGGVVRLPFTGDYTLREKETGTIIDFADVDEEGFPRRILVNEEFETRNRFHWPRSAGVGIALRPFGKLTLAADFTWSQWSKAYIEELPEGALLTEGDGDPNTLIFTDRNFFDLLPQSGQGSRQRPVSSATVDTFQWRAGAEYLVVIPKVVVPLRLGLFRDRSPIADLVTDEGRRVRGFTAGTGLNFSHVVFDVAFERRTSDGVVGIRRRGAAASGGELSRESVREDRLVASLIFRFGADDPIKRGLRSLFVGSKEKSDN